jgi:4-methyl-5(b-hydroxyethyl)-thiazole monophosphate biosynthesis
MSKRVLVPLALGFEELEAIAIIDVLRRAEIEVIVAGVDKKTVSGANGIKVEADTLISEVSSDDLDMVVLPGGWGGTDILAINENVQNILKEMNAKDKKIGAICAAPFALSEAGVLKDNFTCYPSVEERIEKNSGYNSSQMVVRDGNVITSRGPGTAICFGLQIVRDLIGEEMYNGLKEGLLATYCED